MISGSQHQFSFSCNHESKGTDYVKQIPCMGLETNFFKSHSLVAIFKHLFNYRQYSYNEISVLKENYWTEKKSLGNNFQFTNWPQVSVEMSVIYSSYFPSCNQHPKCIAIKPQSN